MSENKRAFPPVSIRSVTDKMIEEIIEVNEIDYPSKTQVVTKAVEDLHKKEMRKIARLANQK